MSLLSTLKKIAKAAPAVLTALPTIVSVVKDVRGAIKKDSKIPATPPVVGPGSGGGSAANPTG